MKTIDYNLKDILKGVSYEQFLIPQFQRRFRWKNSQVKLLVDSLARNYPIGSLLMLARNPEVPLQSRSVEAEIMDSTDSTDKDTEFGSEVYYILDGQQRLTSIARVFLNADPKINYYFDLYKMLQSFDNEDTSWIVTRRRGKKEYKRKDNNRLLRADVVLNQTETDVFVSEYIEDSGDFPNFSRKEEREAAAKIKGVFETIRNYKVPIVVLNGDAPLESVCRVFETINSTGTRLTTFDLAVARFYPDPDLRDMWESGKDTYPILERFEADGERALQVLSLWYSHQAQQFSEPTRSKLLSLPKQFIKSNWDEAIDNLSKAYVWAEENGATPKLLPSHNILVSIAAFFILFPTLINDPARNFRSVLRRWYFSRVLQQGARQAANYQIGIDFDVLVAYAEKGEPLKVEDVRLSVDTIKRTNRAGDSRYKALHCIVALYTQEDLLTGEPLKTDLEDHHIFPRSFTRHGISRNTLDSIANRIIVSQRTNRSLGDTPPVEYFGDLQMRAQEDGTIKDLQRRLTQLMIPGNVSSPNFTQQFTIENFDSFLTQRASILLERVGEIIGKSLIIIDATDIDDE